jgi:hypothetical protein
VELARRHACSVRFSKARTYIHEYYRAHTAARIRFRCTAGTCFSFARSPEYDLSFKLPGVRGTSSPRCSPSASCSGAWPRPWLHQRQMRYVTRYSLTKHWLAHVLGCFAEHQAGLLVTALAESLHAWCTSMQSSISVAWAHSMCMCEHSIQACE